jgi:hypothetical protein
MLFVAVGIATALCYAGLVAWVPLLPSNLYLPLLDLGKITGYTWPSAFQFLGIVAALYVLYGLGYRLVSTGRVATMTVFLFGAVFCVELVGAYPATAVDVFGYIAHGRLLADHHANPFVVAPDAYPFDAIVPFLAFPAEPSQYGPVWVLLGNGLAVIARGDLLAEISAYKATAALAHLCSALLILSIARRLGGSECRARASAFVFLWNPLLLWEMIGNAHNDGLMMLGGLLAVWLLVRGINLLVLPALALGALVKVPVIIVAPLLFVALWRRARAAAVEGFWLALLLAVVVYRPFWEGAQTLTALRRTDLFTASLGSVLRLALTPGFGLAEASNVARWVSLAAFAIVLGVTLLRAPRTTRDRDVVLLGYVTLLAAALLATTWFQAWYLVWPLAFGAALPDWRRHLEVALLSLGGFAQYFVFIYLWVIGVFPPQETLALQLTAYLGIIAPLVLGVVLWSYARMSSHTRETVGAD